MVAFLVLVSVWGAADVAMTAADDRAPTLVLPQEFVEGLGLAMRPGFHDEATYVNSRGMRRTELPPVVADEVRILVLGDSVTFGFDVSNGEDWPAMLEKYLRSRGVPATVMNVGAPGQATDFMLAALKYYAGRIKVDVVLVQNTGNMLALGEKDPGLVNGPQSIIDRLFPDHRPGFVRARSQCPDMSVVQDNGAESVSLPAIVKTLAPHSPAINGIATRFTDRSRASPASKHPIPDACFYPQEGGNYLVREMLGMAQMIDFARHEGVKLVFVRPTYVFDWSGSDGTGVPRSRLPAAYRNGYRGSWPLVENVDRVFDFFESSGARVVDPMSRLRVEPGPSVDVATLYSDYTHYTAEGCRWVSRAVGDELLAKGIVSPVSDTPWKHPAERTSPRDLRYAEMGSVNLVRIACVAVLLSIATFMAGLALQRLLPGAGAASLAASPLLGFFALLAAGLVANLFSLDVYRSTLAVLGAAAAAMAL